MTDAEGRRTTFVWDEGLLSRSTTPGGRTIEFAYDSAGNQTSVSRGGTNGGPYDSTYVIKQYDAYGQLLLEYDYFGGRVTSYTYDAVCNLTRVTEPGNRITTYEHDARGNVTKTTLPAGNAAGATASDHQIAYQRDVRGRPVVVTDQLGAATRYAYDSDDNVLEVWDPDDRLTTFSYDLLGQMITRTRGDQGVDQWLYSAEQQTLRHTNGLGERTTYGHDLHGRVVSTTDALNRTSNIAYDAVGNAVQVRGPDNQGIASTFDATGRLLTETDTAGSQATTTYSYDSDGHITRLARGADAVDLEWDTIGRLTTRTRADGTSVKLEYGYNRDLSAIEYPVGLERDAGGSLHSRTFGKVEYERNVAGDLVSVRDFDGRTFSFEYDANGELTKANYPQGAATITRDRVGRPTSIATPVGDRTYTYSPGGVRQTLTQGNVTTPFAVDGALHLTQAGASANAFDLAEQPIQLAETGGVPTTQTFDAAGQQLTRTSGPTTLSFEYDSNGRRTTERLGGVSQTQYSYNTRGELTGISGIERGGAAFSQSMTYGPDAARRSTTRGGVTKYESWEDGLGGPALLLTQGREAYIYGPGGMPLERVDSAGAASYLWRDAIGSIIGTTDVAGAATATFAYDVWGRRTAGFGSQAGALGFGGQVTEPGTDLQYLRARYYDPQTAQFLTRDPQEAITGQPYLYAAGNPVMFTDPTGESIFGDFFAGLVTGASFGQVKPGGANRCSYLNFAGEQLGGIVDPFRKIKAAGKVAQRGGRVLGDAAGFLGPVRQSSRDIANGHAFRKHVVERGEFPDITTPDQLARRVERVVTNPSASRSLARGRSAYDDEGTNTLVIRDPRSPDGGTVFRPSAGRRYYDGLD